MTLISWVNGICGSRVSNHARQLLEWNGTGVGEAGASEEKR